MAEKGFMLFETPIGRCGIAWGPGGVVGVQLPEAREPETRARLLRRFPDAAEAPPPPFVRDALDGIARLLRGETSDLASVPLDMGRLAPFQRRVYEAARTIAPGTTLSYGAVAERLGAPGAARAVGQALGRNPFAILVPCHRVLAAGGRTGGFSAPGGAATKLRLLSLEAALAAAATEAAAAAVPLGFDAAAAVEHLRASDPALRRLIDAVGPLALEPKPTSSLFVALAEAIVYQQLTAKAAATIFGRVCALFPRAHEGLSPERIARASDARLRSAGLSRPKMLALRDLARRTLAGAIPSFSEVCAMEDEAIVERLVEVRGIGRWTVEMLLIFRLGRPDVLPADDYGVRQGFSLVFNRGAKKGVLPSRKELEARAARWRPYRTVASWYLWRALDRARS